jgi:2-oxoglutarate decarboxylase
VIDDPAQPSPEQVDRLLLCTGKIYYELAAEKAKLGADNVAIVRIEQLYPLPERKLAAVLDRYSHVDDIRWVQEEPANQGAWPHLGLVIPEALPQVQGKLRRVSRRPMAAPASGFSKVHEVEQRDIITKAFA